MLKITLQLAAVTLATAVSFQPASAQGHGLAVPTCTQIHTAQQVHIAGPYATIRRANEVAAIARQRGYQTLVYHNGDGYYVKAW